MSTETKTPERKYSEAEEAAIVAFAEANGGLVTYENADTLAEQLDKDVRSIRAKASRMGIYRGKAKESVNGGKVESKADIAEEIAAIVGKNMEGLEKAPKAQLGFIRDYLKAA